MASRGLTKCECKVSNLEECLSCIYLCNTIFSYGRLQCQCHGFKMGINKTEECELTVMAHDPIFNDFLMNTTALFKECYNIPSDSNLIHL